MTRAAGRAAGTARGLAAARTLTVGADTANVVLLGLLVRHRGPVAAAIACGLYAVYPDAVVAAHTFLLEPWLNLFCLAGAVAIFDRGRLAGSAPGFAPPLPGRASPSPGRAPPLRPRPPPRARPAGRTGPACSAAGSCSASPSRSRSGRWSRSRSRRCCARGRAPNPPGGDAGRGRRHRPRRPLLPFALLAPTALARGVLIGQLVRNADGSRHLPQRVADLAGLGLHPFWPHERLLLAAVVAALIGCCAAAYLAVGRRRLDARTPDAKLLSTPTQRPARWRSRRCCCGRGSITRTTARSTPRFWRSRRRCR